MLLTVRFTGWHIREEQEAEVLTHGEGQVQAGEETLGELGIKTRIVQTEIAEGHEEPRRRVQSDAEPPYVRFRAKADRGTDRWQIIGNLDTHKVPILWEVYLKTCKWKWYVWREKDTWQCVPVESSKWKVEDMKTHVTSPNRGRNTVPMIHAAKGTRRTSALSWPKMFEPGIILICSYNRSDDKNVASYNHFLSNQNHACLWFVVFFCLFVASGKWDTRHTSRVKSTTKNVLCPTGLR